MSSTSDFLKSLTSDAPTPEVVKESYADISTFFEDATQYLDITYHSAKTTNKDISYVGPISSGGVVTESIDKICKELIAVNAYNEAISIYDDYFEKINMLKDMLSKDDTVVIADTIGYLQKAILDTKMMRDEYFSKRKAVLAKCNALVKRIKDPS